MTLLRLNWLAFVSVKALASRPPSPLVRGNVWQHHRIAGTSLEPKLPSERGNTARGQVNCLGYGKNAWDWTIRSQAPTGSNAHGEGSTTKWWWAGECDARRLKI